MSKKEHSTKQLRERMVEEYQNKSILKDAVEYSFSYIDSVMSRNVYPTEEALKNLSKFDEELPVSSASAESVLKHLNEYGSPATVAQTGGRYFGLVNGGMIPVSLSVRWLSDSWDQNTPLFVTSPIVSKLESVVEKWFQQLFNLDTNTVVGFVSGTSMAILCGLAAARFELYKRLNWDINQDGLFSAPKIRVVLSKQAHGTVIKALCLLGIGKKSLEFVNTDDQGRMRVDCIPPLDDKTILILQAGNVNSGAFDKFDEIMEKAREVNAWVHIDGAFGLWAGASKKLKYLTNSIEKADSWSVDGHKTLNTPYDSGIILCKHKDALVSALQASGSYIVYGEERDGMLFTPEMSRRSRVVELWATLKYLGKNGIDELVFNQHKRARQFGNKLQENGFRILNDIVFNQVLVACDNDEMTKSTLMYLQKSRVCWCGGSSWDEKQVIRISVCSWATSSDDISASVKAFVAAREQAISKQTKIRIL